ncbi:hypothetical protein D8I24_5685 [Cupriavidus necator H850]|uniref:hypothetical protein n=1 Tax=Cupriavidus necator TaxID=106590 RepID=UPI00129DDFF1|nr:hypothetical protein [Cupriavidus necator]KAI3598739.1 hypothetical protein D8I24_5685 [Cupriavidus necator H850]
MAEADFIPAPQCLTAKELLAAERRFASRWWSILQAMQEMGQLPEWADRFLEGRSLSADYDELRKAQEATNTVISAGRRQYRYEVWDARRETLVRGIGTRKEADDIAEGVQTRYPGARVVRVIDTSRMVFVPVEAQQLPSAA